MCRAAVEDYVVGVSQPGPDQAEAMVKKWNEKFGIGTEVFVQRPGEHDVTVRPAYLNKDGQAVVCCEQNLGPVPLEWVRPVGRGEEL